MFLKRFNAVRVMKLHSTCIEQRLLNDNVEKTPKFFLISAGSDLIPIRLY